MCGANDFQPIFRYERPPEGEIRFRFVSDRYDRSILVCQVCGHFVSHHNMNMEGMYEGEYADATYGGDGLRSSFERIMNLPDAHSDNAGRVRALEEFAAPYFVSSDTSKPRLLDVGSGLGVFPARISKQGWDCVALDPDPRVVDHLRLVAGVEAVRADFLHAELEPLGTFDVITFNKVLEHVWNPVAMLERALALLRPHGFVYVEVPDGEAARREGFGRQEFFIAHHHSFSAVSLTSMVARSGLQLISCSRLREPSSKFTLRAFARAAT